MLFLPTAYHNLQMVAQLADRDCTSTVRIQLPATCCGLPQCAREVGLVGRSHSSSLRLQLSASISRLKRKLQVAGSGW